MIHRISLALLLVIKNPSIVNAFLPHGIGLVRYKAVSSITRPFVSISDESNWQREDEIKLLNDKVAEYKRELLTVVDSEEKTAIIKHMTAISNNITALRTIRGTVASPISHNNT